MCQVAYNLYPEIEPFNKNWLKVGSIHTKFIMKNAVTLKGLQWFFYMVDQAVAATQCSDAFLTQNIIELF